MRSSRMIETFTDRYPSVGPIMWILSVQYYLTQIIVAEAWKIHYSWLYNTISDLGNTACATYGGRFVCSPRHNLMNASFITLGIFMTIGAILIRQEFKKTRGTLAGFSCMAVAGIGTLLVGLFPENTISALHVLGATLPFLIGNIGIVVLGCMLNIPKPLRIYTLASGVMALIGLALFTTHNYLGIGIGGMERVTAYPQTIWLIIFGLYISRNHFLKRATK